MMRISVPILCCFILSLGSGCQSGTRGFQNPFQNPFARSFPETASTLDTKSKDEGETDSGLTDDGELNSETGEISSAVASMQPIPDSLGQSDREKQRAFSNLEKAEAAYLEHNLPKAAAFYNEVVRLDPQHIHAHHRLAIIADQQKNYPLAERHYTTALNLDPENLNLLNDLGYSFYLQQRYEESERYLSYVMTVDPSNLLAMKNLGLVSAARGEIPEAVALLQQGGLSPQQSQQLIQQAALLAQEKRPARDTLGIASSNPLSGVSSSEIQTTANSTTNNSKVVHPEYPLQRKFDVTAETNTFQSEAIGNQPSGRMEVETSPRAPTPTRVEKPIGDSSSHNAHPSRQRTSADGHMLERAALNTGFGNLFPITSSAEGRTTPRVKPVSWENTNLENTDAQKAYYEQFGYPASNAVNVRHALHQGTKPPVLTASYPRQTHQSQTQTEQLNQWPEKNQPVREYQRPVSDTPPSGPSPQKPRFDQFPQQQVTRPQQEPGFARSSSTPGKVSMGIIPATSFPSSNRPSSESPDALREYQNRLQQDTPVTLGKNSFH